ncbi:MAG: hypothetical protein JXR03_08100 [Cyclobacteriaceae bacterium]
MKRIVSLIFYSTLLISCFHISSAQSRKKTKDLKDFIPTENLDSRKEANTYKNMPKRKVIEYIYKNELDGLLYGNPCAVEETRKMGFEYVFQPLGVQGSVSADDQFTNNVMVNLKLIFTRSPFWKLILNRRIKKCGGKSGDIVG